MMNVYILRSRDAWRWRHAGLTYREIAQRLDVSICRARQIVEKRNRIENRKSGLLESERRNFAEHMKVIWPEKNAKRNRRHKSCV